MAQTIFDFTQPTIATPTVAPDMSGANLLKQVSRTLGNIGAQQKQEWEIATNKKSAQEGLMEGTQEQPKYRQEGTMGAEAFNQAAQKSYTANLELKSSHQMASFAEEFKNDPEGYQKASTGYINGMREELMANKQTESMAKLMEGRMMLTQQSAGYNISKTYMANQSAKLRVDNDNLIQTLRINTFKEAGGIFSTDPMSKNLALQGFALNKQALDASLHQVGQDGTPIYSPEAIKVRQDNFHREFYSRGVRDWVSENEITPADYNKIKNGNLTVDIEGLGSINILNELGVDKHAELVRFTNQKLVEKNATRKKERQYEKDLHREERTSNGVSLMGDLLSGKGAITTEQIVTMERIGQINAADAKAALKLVTDPRSGQDDPEIIADLMVRQINGENVSADIRKNSSAMTGKTYMSLMESNAKYQHKREANIDNDNEKWIVKEAVKKNQFGIEDPRTVRLAADIVDRYRQNRKDGMSEDLAYEKARNAIDIVKDRKNKRLYNSVPKYMERGDNNTIDINATMEATLAAKAKGLISMDQFQIELDRLRLIKNGQPTTGE